MTDLHITGKTPEGKLVLGGVFSFYETHGLPLDIILSQLWEKNALPDWIALVADMIKAGRPLDRTMEAIEAAVYDACYPMDVRDQIIDRLHVRVAPEKPA
jgi:hypothetical protein